MTVTLGVDVATADVRAVAVRPDGQVVASAHYPLPAPVPTGAGVEQAPVHAATALAVIAEVMAVVTEPVAGISVTATSGTVVPTDARGHPAGPALTYRDQRGALELKLIRARLAGAGENFTAMPALGRLAWLHRHRPAERYLHVSDLVNAALAGRVIATDSSHALKSGADPVACTWRSELLAAARLPAETLPPLLPPGRVAGRVAGTAAARTGLPAGTPIVLGMTDGCTGQIAAGAVHLGDAASVLGTTLVLKTVTSREIVRPPAVYSHRAPDGMWWPGGASNTGAGALRRFGDAGALAKLGAAAAAHGPARHVRYPLTGRGERFPFHAPQAEQFVLGSPAGEVDEFRATLEGVAFTERLGYQVLAGHGAALTGVLRTVGGGSRGIEWLAVRATVLGRQLEVPAEPSSSFGAAVIAASATVHNGLTESATAMVRTVAVIDPVAAEQAALEEGFLRFAAELEQRGWHPAGSPRRAAG